MGHLEITEVVLVQCNIANNSINMIQESCIHLFLTYGLVKHYIFHLKELYF